MENKDKNLKWTITIKIILLFLAGPIVSIAAFLIIPEYFPNLINTQYVGDSEEKNESAKPVEDKELDKILEDINSDSKDCSKENIDSINEKLKDKELTKNQRDEYEDLIEYCN